jgi:quercetin dioxygenase-like cupin family protein
LAEPHDARGGEHRRQGNRRDHGRAQEAASALPSGALDVVTADSKHNKVEFENQQVRVLRYHYEPGEKSPMHGHPDNVQVMLTDSEANVTTPNGKTDLSSGKAGQARWRQAGQHVVENTGDKALEGILVEMKGRPGAETTAR